MKNEPIDTTFAIEVRQAVGPAETARMDTQGLRRSFLIEGMFQPDRISLTYTHMDRMLLGGIMPVAKTLHLSQVPAVGSERLLDRREIAVVNLGGAGRVGLDDDTFSVGTRDCLYVGPGSAASLTFARADPVNPAAFYVVSAPATRRCDTALITLQQARKVHLGAVAEANERTINQYVHPDICDSNQLLLGITTFSEGSVWNTMPAHLHDRRSEAYLYFDMAEATRVFHLMGEPHETRHLVVRNREAILSPGWSIHSGAGTGPYSFVWAMAGDNKSFTDMDMVPMEALR